MNNHQESASTEFLKAVSDHFKHITTLSSGFILVMATFVEKLFEQPEWQPLLIVAFISFAAAILFSVIAQAFFIDRMRLPQIDVAEGSGGIATGVTLAAWSSFVLGTLSVIVFCVKNLL